MMPRQGSEAHEETSTALVASGGTSTAIVARQPDTPAAKRQRFEQIVRGGTVTGTAFLEVVEKPVRCAFKKTDESTKVTLPLKVRAIDIQLFRKHIAKRWITLGNNSIVKLLPAASEDEEFRYVAIEGLEKEVVEKAEAIEKDIEGHNEQVERRRKVVEETPWNMTEFELREYLEKMRQRNARSDLVDYLKGKIMQIEMHYKRNENREPSRTAREEFLWHRVRALVNHQDAFTAQGIRDAFSPVWDFHSNRAVEGSIKLTDIKDAMTTCLNSIVALELSQEVTAFFTKNIEMSAGQQVTYLQKIDLGDKQLKDEGLDQLVCGLMGKAGQVIHVDKLMLHKNGITSHGLRSLISYIKASTYPVREIHLSHNFVDIEGMRNLVAAIVESDVYPASSDDWEMVPLWLRLEYNRIQNPISALSGMREELNKGKQETQFKFCLISEEDEATGRCTASRCAHLCGEIDAKCLLHVPYIHNQMVGEVARSSLLNQRKGSKGGKGKGKGGKGKGKGK